MDDRGRRRIAVVLLFGALSLATLYASFWWLYRTTRHDLETELGRRLQHVAILLAADLADYDLASLELLHLEFSARPDSQLAFLAEPEVVRVRDKFVRVAERIAAANVTLYAPDETALVDLNPRFLPGSSEIFNITELREALTGNATHTALYESGNQYLMTGFAPVQSDFGELFAVGVEGGVQFFDGLRRLRRSLIGIGSLSLLFLSLLGMVFASLQNRLAQAEMAAERSESLAAMGRMTAGIAHEIRNPLGIIRAAATRLKKRYDDPEAPDEKFDFIADEVDRLNTILSGYLNFAKDTSPSFETTDLIPLVRRTLHHMQPELERAGVELRLDVPEQVLARVDPQRIQQLLMNLILNSVQAMPQGGTVVVAMESDAQGMVLRVEDDGPGFPKTVLQRAFEPFLTTKEQGSGLGLAMVKRIVEQHRGTIELSNRETSGAKVVVRLRS